LNANVHARQLTASLVTEVRPTNLDSSPPKWSILPRESLRLSKIEEYLVLITVLEAAGKVSRAHYLLAGAKLMFFAPVVVVMHFFKPCKQGTYSMLSIVPHLW
jgi:hypothetical protein